jgi:hypothetical protein
MKLNQLIEAKTPAYSIPENAVKTQMTLLEYKIKSRRAWDDDFKGDRFDIYKNPKLISLEGLPSKISSGAISLDNLGIENLEHFPRYVFNNVSLKWMKKLKSLKGIENTFIGGTFWLDYIEILSTIDFMPTHCNGFSINDCESFTAINEHNKSFNTNATGLIAFRHLQKLTDITGIGKVFKSGKSIHFNNCPKISKGGLGLLQIEFTASKGKLVYSNQFQEEKFARALDIIRDHYEKERDILECKLELIEKGFEEYAKL